MRTETNTTHVCQFCGVDFTRRSYAERINHSNHCDYWNTNCSGNRFNDAKTDEEKIHWLKDTIAMDADRQSFEVSLEIFECVLILFKSGNLEGGKYLDAAKYMESKRKDLEKLYNQEVLEEIDELKRKYQYDLRELKSKLVY